MMRRRTSSAKDKSLKIANLERRISYKTNIVCIVLSSANHCICQGRTSTRCGVYLHLSLEISTLFYLTVWRHECWIVRCGIPSHLHVIVTSSQGTGDGTAFGEFYIATGSNTNIGARTANRPMLIATSLAYVPCVHRSLCRTIYK